MILLIFSYYLGDVCGVDYAPKTTQKINTNSKNTHYSKQTSTTTTRSRNYSYMKQKNVSFCTRQYAILRMGGIEACDIHTYVTSIQPTRFCQNRAYFNIHASDAHPPSICRHIEWKIYKICVERHTCNDLFRAVASSTHINIRNLHSQKLSDTHTMHIAASPSRRRRAWMKRETSYMITTHHRADFHALQMRGASARSRHAPSST